VFQPSLSDLGQPLSDVTFVVVDLETTGGSPTDDRITEFGAVKVRGGEVIGQLSTLVDPGIGVPTSITVLTGIADHMLHGRPTVQAVLPSFVEFSRGAALVAHNARFDTAFLNSALRRLDYPPLDNPVVCTAQLARRLVGDEVTDRRLGTLAMHFRSGTVPNHRALADARATVDVFHALLEQAGTFGVVTLEDLIAFSRVRNMPLFTSRRSMADDLPSSPGVYRFVSASGEVLYVGKATDLRARVRQYFGGDTRRRITALVREARTVQHTTTATAIEAEVLESRLIREHRPRFNTRGKRVRTPVWVTLTGGAYPRLSIARRPPARGRAALGPLPSRRVAQQVVDAVQDAFPIRRCTAAMRADTRFDACVLAELGRCLAPCDRDLAAGAYGEVVEQVVRTLEGDLTTATAVLDARMARRAAAGRYAEAATTRDHIAALIRWVVRDARDRALRSAGVVAASRTTRTGREVLVQQGGWLIGTAIAQPGGVGDAVELILSADPSTRATGPVPDTPPPPDEVRILQRWLGAEGTRVERVDGVLAWPIDGGAVGDAQRRRLAAAAIARPHAALADKRLVRRRRS
jgi:DNA polymerase III subunit epsilon